MTIACPDCGLLEDLPHLGPRSRAVCRLCRTDLEHRNGRSVAAGLACSLGTFLLLIPANVLPLVQLHMFGMHSENTIAGGIEILWSHGWVLLAGLSAAFAIVFPLLRGAILSAVLTAVFGGFRPGWVGPAFRWACWLDIWAMPDVFLLGAFIGYYRLINVNQLNVNIAVGGMCFMGAAFLAMLSRATIDRRRVWRCIGPEAEVRAGESTLSCIDCDLVQPISQEGKPCPRCGARLHTRKPDAIPYTAALLAGAFILFFPANIIPMNTSIQLGQHVDYTIFHGIRALFQAGLWPLGCLIFCTSIAIPMVKILATAWCCWTVWHRSTGHLVLKTKIFHLIVELGRWSKTDPFVIVFFVPLLHFGALASSDAAGGATAFIMMTFLTMIAAQTFDPRLMWDAAAEGAYERT